LGEDKDGYIKIPRGLLETLTDKCKNAKIDYNIEDHREKGRPIRVKFEGELRLQQNLAGQQMMSFDNGILNAATAFGKTAVCSHLIAQKQVNTLILLENTSLISQWIDELSKFLIIDEKPPEYKTKTGRIKKRLSVIGTLKAGKDTLTGIVDIAMIGSLYKKGKFHEKINSYGMVIMDECHHAASATAQEILKKINAKYVYGVSATTMRSDNLERINYLLLGPIRHKFTALERTKEQGIDHLVFPRYTRVVAANKLNDINEAYALISSSEIRNELIISDIKTSVKSDRTPVILTRYKEHAKLIYDSVRDAADHVFILYGDNTGKENESIRMQLKEIPDNKTLILVATGQKIGEGFDYPRLDTLMLAAPVSFAGRLEQYVGRLNRDYPGKESVTVYDYIDSHIGYFNNMYLRRLRTYKNIGFHITSNKAPDKQVTNHIFDSDNYTEVFERDIIEAEKEIVIASPSVTKNKIERLLYLAKPRQEAGVNITVITQEPEIYKYENLSFIQSIISDMKDAGINVVCLENTGEHFAVIDDLIVWHGGLNLLGKEDAWDNIIRVKDTHAAAELMEMSLGE
jgi:superfamily II DNA or RNA helicase